MALSREDKGDVKNALGKALANKVSKATRDGSGRTQEIANRIQARANKSSGQTKSSAQGINSERKRQGYKPMSAERTRIHEGMDKFL